VAAADSACVLDACHRSGGLCSEVVVAVEVRRVRDAAYNIRTGRDPFAL
jgi:hypothetical protein